MLCLAVVVGDGAEERKLVEYLCLFLPSKPVLPLLLPGKAHPVLVECSMTTRALNVMLLLVSSSEAYEMPCEWFGQCWILACIQS
jgi:hypothetical protein